MKIFKEGGHRLFESDSQTAAAVGEMLLDLEKNGMDAVRKYSERFDGWNPKSSSFGGGDSRGRREGAGADTPRHGVQPGERP